MDVRRLVTGAAEIRAAEDGQHLHGVLIQEGRAASGGRREVFTPRSVEWPSTGVGILTAHRQAPEIRAVPSRESDGRITVKALATPAIREAVEAGRKWMSVEFHSLEERTTKGGVREILGALVSAAALVDHPEYDTTMAEVRQRSRMSGSMAMRSAVDCRCGPGDCASALVEEIEIGASDLLGYFGDYSKPLGPATAVIEGGRLVTTIEIAAGVSYADDLVALMESGVSPVIRPYPDPMKSRTRKEGQVLVYDLLAIAGLIVTYTDQAGGFEAATLAGEAENRRGRTRVRASRALDADSGGFGRRRVWL